MTEHSSPEQDKPEPFECKDNEAFYGALGDLTAYIYLHRPEFIGLDPAGRKYTVPAAKFDKAGQLVRPEDKYLYIHETPPRKDDTTTYTVRVVDKPTSTPEFEATLLIGPDDSLVALDAGQFGNIYQATSYLLGTKLYMKQNESDPDNELLADDERWEDLEHAGEMVEVLERIQKLADNPAITPKLTVTNYGQAGKLIQRIIKIPMPFDVYVRPGGDIETSESKRKAGYIEVGFSKTIAGNRKVNIIPREDNGSAIKSQVVEVTLSPSGEIINVFSQTGDMLDTYLLVCGVEDYYLS